MASTARLGLKQSGGARMNEDRKVGMASTARLGLKRPGPSSTVGGRPCRNGLYSPFGIETIPM